MPETPEGRKSMAREFLESRAFRIAEQIIKEKTYRAWENTKPEDKETREEIWLILKSFDAMKKQVQTILDDAEVDIAHENYRKQRDMDGRSG